MAVGEVAEEEECMEAVAAQVILGQCTVAAVEGAGVGTMEGVVVGAEETVGMAGRMAAAVEAEEVAMEDTAAEVGVVTATISNS